MQYEANAFKVSVIFPKRYPEGSSVSSSVWNGMTTELRRSEDDDDSHLYFLTVADLDRVEALQKFVARWRQPFRQRAMYFDYHPVRFELLVE